MTDLFEKSIHTLELPKVLELLRACAVTEEGKARALSLRPATGADEVRRRLAETGAAFRLLSVRGTPPLGGVRPVAASLQRADRGGSLNTRELLDIAAVLHAARVVKEYGKSEGERSCIDHLFSRLIPNRYLEEKITTCIVGEDEIADAASGELSDIRRHMRAAASKVREILQKIITSSQAKYLQENIVTMRSDRYVVPVRAECKGDVPGLVHDVSSSGATLFIEPMAVVQANNQLRELAAREKKEIERILAELSAEAAGFQEGILGDYDSLVALDCVFARAGLSSRMGGMEPELGDEIFLKSARHPLLDPRVAVANDLSLGGVFDTLVITGPNTGGKTVTLKTIGLLTLMAQCGLHIPVRDGSKVAVFSRVLADIGDEQSIAQSLSTFSSHMTNIVGILDQADHETLILFDELGAGTDPVEGAALAAAIIETARERGALLAATTHYAELKVYAMTTPGVENASCEFNVDTLAPTYRLLVGIPGKSNAFAISRRLGLSQEIIDRAAARVTAENVRFEDVLTQLDAQRQAMEAEKRAAVVLRLEAEQSAKEIKEHKAVLEKERAKAAERARAEAQGIIDEARAAADTVFAELNQMRRRQAREQDWQSVNDSRADLRRRLNEAESAVMPALDDLPPPPPTRPAAAGDRVELIALGTKADVLGVNKDGTLQLQAGILKITARQSEVRVLEGESGALVKAIAGNAEAKLRSLGVSPELDLRGMTADEALPTMEQFMDNATMAKLQQITIIHGKGTGALRRAVHQRLKGSRYVKSFRLGRFGEGEDGVTIIELK